MRTVIINGSPRDREHSNTEKIIKAFAEGMAKEGKVIETYAISNRNQWDRIRQAFETHTDIIIALPLFVECAPGLLLEFLETLPKKDENTQMSFILQGGFSEGSQLRCGENWLKKLPSYFNCTYGGTLVKGDNFSLRIRTPEQNERILSGYRKMGELFARTGNFEAEEFKKFTGPEYLPKYVQLMLGFVFKTIGKKFFWKAAVSWGCTEPLDYRPYQQ